MSKRDEAVDFESVRRNAKAEGIPLSEITIVYEALSESEIQTLRELNLLVSESANIALAKFAEDGRAYFEQKAKSVLYLAA